MVQTFNDNLLALLKKDSRFVDKETGGLIRSEIINKALAIDVELIEALLSDKDVKEKFFTEIKGHWVFGINKFVNYIQDKNFLSDSYTKFKNKIGLNIDGKFLNERKEVALVWPFKDCVLEGAMTKEDEKRNEIFFNEVLAQDEIDRLLDPKALTNFRRYTVNGEEKVTDFKRDSDGTIRENFIIKGNNLLALHCLKKEFQGEVKLIYIDPPYYFKNKTNDSFGYNSNFKLSTWLTFMKNRLEVARELLRSDGTIFVQINDDGQAYLKLLMEEIFGVENFINHITIKVKSSAGFKTVNMGLMETSEYIYIFSKSKSNANLKDMFVETSYDKNYNLIVTNPDEDPNDWVFDIIDNLALKEIKLDIFPKEINERIKYELRAKFALNNPEKVFRYTAINDDAGKETLDARIKSLEDDKVHVVETSKGIRYIHKGQQITFYKIKLREIDGNQVPSEQLTNIWTDIRWEGIANEGLITLKKGKKPERLLKRIFDICTNKNDIVLDFFLGSGTTCAVAHKMGRQYIGIEQLDYNENDSVVRLKNVVKGDTTGISKSVNWKGGGEFIYCELMNYNKEAIDKIQSTKSIEDLIKIWEEIVDHYFLNYDVDIKRFNDNQDEFKKLNFEEQKKILIEMLNKNQLYVNLSEIEDAQFKVSGEDKELNKKFYGL